MSVQQYEQKAKDKVASFHLMRKFFILLAILVLAMVAYGIFADKYVYSDGNRAGIVRKISHKGFLYKTWEGELQTGIGIGQVGGGDIWQFTANNDQAVISALERAAETGKRVSLHYQEKKFQFSFMGDTHYFVDRVEEVKE